jgi:hypothetical protein
MKEKTNQLRAESMRLLSKRAKRRRESPPNSVLHQLGKESPIYSHLSRTKRVRGKFLNYP